MKSISQLIIPRYLAQLTDADGGVLENAALAVNDDKIIAVDSLDAIRKKYRAANEITLDQHIVLPGLVNAHTHASMSLLRGYADDLPLMQWLEQHIWPAEGKWVDEQFIEVGANLAMLEMIRGGTTCFNDMYFYPDVVARCAASAGMRACVGMIVLDFPSVWAQSSEEYINKGLAVRDETRHSPLITTAFAPHAPYTVSDEPLDKIRTLAEELECMIHMHVHETVDEVEGSIQQHKMRPLERLHKLGLLSPKLCAVHMVHLLPGEIESVAESGVRIVHCPQSNLKLGNGFCPVDKLTQHNITVAIGTDGAASNNDLDMFAETQTAALLAKGASANASALPAPQALQAATTAGAKALGLDDQIGALTPGKQADFIAVDLSAANTQPVYNPISQLIYATTASQVSDVWVNGKRLLEGREFTTLDEAEILAKAREWGVRVAGG